MERLKTTLSVELTAREAALLEILCLLDISVPATVAKTSASMMRERQNGTKRAEQKEELAELLWKIRQELYAFGG